jgi:bifunctional non-homologous end joining protein LigD
MGLREYHGKRDFAVTPEPRGEEKKDAGRSFVIQKHAASHLHYDFRLEMEGVLKSWAVPKGPSLDPSQKRLAMMTEDHPVDYGGFEGIIPEGEYGGGTVLLWDRGQWEPVGDPHTDLRAGRLKFRLHGAKLRGAWMLVRTKGRGPRDDGRSWLLFKERDDEARPASEYDVTAARPESVATGRDLEAIAGDRDRVWRSNRAATVARKSARAASRTPTATPSVSPGIIPGARKAAILPKAPKAQLATLVDAAPDGDGWLHEVKLDGYRILGRAENGRAQLISRNGNDWTAQFPAVAGALAALPVRQAIVDGEVAIVLPDGRTSFQALQNFMNGGGGGALAFFAFDLLHLDGYDLTPAALEDRKAALERLLAGSTSLVRYSQHVVGTGPAFFEEACRRQVEGIVSKQRRAPYQGTRTRTWVKVKCLQEQEFVIGGFTDPEGTREGLGALLLGIQDKDGLRYVGRVGTGFTDKILRDLRRRLKALEQTASPFVNKVTGRAVGRAHWVKPDLVGEVAFSEWTDDGKLRHPSFKGLRTDKAAHEIVREKPVEVAAVTTPPATTRARPRPSSKKTKAGGETDVAGVRVTHPDRVVYPEPGLTKLDLARYYESIADWILPHLKDRPTTLVRCPDGLSGPCFYQKHTGAWAPEPLRRVKIQEQKKVGEYLVADDGGGLVGLVQIGILEIHTWNSTVADLERPDRLVFDLDPDPSVEWPRVIEAARLVRKLLADRGLTGFVKTTGGKGLHVVAPLKPRADWDAGLAFARGLAAEMVRREPKSYTDNMSKARRAGKIYVDFLRNARGATSVAAYSTRAKPGAPVSTPLTWEELSPKVRSADYTVATVSRRLARLTSDPWREYASKARVLPH